jgi:TonB family protein
MRSFTNAAAISLIVLGCVATMPCVVGSGFGFDYSSHAPQEWQTYTVNSEEFSVSLPDPPAMTSSSTLIRIGKTRMQRVLGSYGAGVAYAIFTYENPIEETLDDFIARMKQRRSRNRTWSNELEISAHGFSGKQFRVVEREVEGSVQFFRTKNHLYQFEAMGAGMDDLRVQQFFSSIVLGKKLQGVKLSDGPGAESPDQDPSAQIFRGNDVDRKVVVLTKPEPSYTEPARQASSRGAVVLKVVFASTGRVENIQIVSGLPNGLNKQAIAAAKQIRFVPAMKNGQFVSVELQLEYHFNIY